MFVSLRSALLIFAALSASSVAPAQVATSAETVASITTASLPKVVAPRVLPIEEPVSTEVLPDPLAPLPDSDVAQPVPPSRPAKPSGDLASMVTQLRSSDPGSRELECLAVGIYFEAKSEPLA